MQLVKRGFQVFLLFLVVQLTKLSLRLKRRYEVMMSLNKTLPMPKSLSFSFMQVMFGMGKVFFQNLDRLLHFRLDLFAEVDQQQGKKTDTILLPGSFERENPLIFSRDPAVVKFILKDEFDSFVKPDLLRDVLKDLLGKGIFAVSHGSTSPEDPWWKFQRKTASKIFTKNIFTGHVYNTLVKNTQKLRNSIDDLFVNGAETVRKDMKLASYAFTMDSIGDIGFGVDLNTLDSKAKVPFAEAFDSAVNAAMLRTFLPYWETLGPIYPFERAIKRDVKILNDFSYGIIKQRRQEDISEKGDIVSLFMAADPSLPDEKVRDILLSFMIAGRDTTACTLTFAFFLLATHPEIQEKMFDEIKQFLTDGKAPDFDSMKELRFLDAVVFETLRLFPPVPIELKQCAKEAVLPDGTIVPKGVNVHFEVFVMTHDAAVYEKPMEFRPERWMKNDRKIQEFDQYDFPVFQAGPRICLGKDLAFYEAKMVLVEMIKKYKFSLPAEKQPKDLDLFRKDVAMLNGKAIYQTNLTLTFKGPMELEIQKRA